MHVRLPLHASAITWDVVHIAAVDQEVPVARITKRRQGPNDAHAGSYVLPQGTLQQSNPHLVALASHFPTPIALGLQQRPWTQSHIDFPVQCDSPPTNRMVPQGTAAS